MGVKQLLGALPYSSNDITPICEHEDDGEIYGSSKSKIVLRCAICGEHYEEENVHGYTN